MRQRNHALTLRLNDEELKHLKDQVVASGLTTQTFLRLLIAGQKIKPRRPEVFIDLLHELSAIGNNINQIARSVNAGIATAEDARRGLFLLDKVYELMYQVANP